MEIPTCNYNLNNIEYYVKSIQNDNYIPYVFGFIISVTSIGLLTSIYYTNLEYKQEIKNKIKLIIFIILVLIFLSLLGYSAFKIGIYNTKNLSNSYSLSEAIHPCYSKYTKSIIGLSDNIIEQESLLAGSTIPIKIKFVTADNQIVDSSYNIIKSNVDGLKSYSNTNNLALSTKTTNTNPYSEESQTIETPYNTRTATSTSDICGNATPGSASIRAESDNTTVLGNSVNIRNNSVTPTSTIRTTNTSNTTQYTTNLDSTNQQNGNSLLDANGNFIVTG
jgi:hypothetical protein